MAVSVRTKRWTLEELHSLPEDDNTYELVHGVLFVTPPPTDPHETIGARLHRLLDSYVEAHGLGYVYRPRAVVMTGEDQVEPDLFVRQPNPNPAKDWKTAPLPSLVVEILSPSTRRRDLGAKRAFYMELGVELWLVDPEGRVVTVCKPGEADRVEREWVKWRPAGVPEALAVEVAAIFE